MIKHIIFDVDKTIYPSSCGFGDEMDRLISQYTADFVKVSLDEANFLRKGSVKNYGTTLRWLQEEHGLTDTEHYLDYVHPKDVHNYLPNKEKVNSMFNSLKIGISILSNGPIENINRILNYYNIGHLFNPIIDIKDNSLKGKPEISSYKKILKDIDCSIENILFVDDVEDYLIPFHDLGGNVLLINEDKRDTKMNFDEISNILELPAYLKKRFNVV